MSRGGEQGAVVAAGATCAAASAMTTEHLALIGFCARLGALSTDADAEESTTRDEARLLMGLLRLCSSGPAAEEDSSSGSAEEMSRESSAAAPSPLLLCKEEIIEDYPQGAVTTSSSEDSHEYSNEERLYRGQDEIIEGQQRVRGRGGDEEEEEPFSFSCPSLSMAESTSPPGRGGAPSSRPPSFAAGAATTATKTTTTDLKAAGIDDYRPSSLLSRPLLSSDRAGVTPLAETMATNLMRSLGSAILWRGRIWIESLARVARLKEREARGREEDRAAINVDGDDDSMSDQGHREEEEEEDNQGPRRTFLEEGDSESNEIKVIRALARSISGVRIESASTSFRVLSQKIDGPPPLRGRRSSATPTAKLMQRALEVGREKGANNGRDDLILIDPVYLPPPKKRTRQVSFSPTLDLLGHRGGETKRSHRGGERYQIKHGLKFEAVLKVVIDRQDDKSGEGGRGVCDKEYEISLCAPGYVVGTFLSLTSEAGSGVEEDGTEVLGGVSVELDTDVLALSLERQSRLIVRRAAEAEMRAGAGATSAEKEAAEEAKMDEEEQRSPKRVRSPNQDDSGAAVPCPATPAPVVTLRHFCITSPPGSWSRTHHNVSLPGIAKGLTLEEAASTSVPGRVLAGSPTEFLGETGNTMTPLSPSHHFSPSLSGITASTTTATAMEAALIPQGSFLPSLVSPSPTRRKSWFKVMGQLRERVPTPPYTSPSQDKKDDDEDHRGNGGKDWCCSVKKRERGRGTSLPALVKVACAAMHEQ